MRQNRVFLSAALLSFATLVAFVAPSCTTPVAPPQNPPQGQPPPPLAITNPVMPGDYPDPSVIRVGNEYWASATTSEWAPHFPLLRSTNLMQWEQVGYIFQTAPEWTDGNYWAPELVADKGRYFVYYTAHKKAGPLCVGVATAPQPAGPYTDHGPLVCQEVGSIDGMLVRDENDKPFLVWKEDGNSRGLPTPIWAQPLSEDGTKLEGDKTQILLNDVPWEGQLIEGPFIFKRNNWFYMVYAGAGCCGRGCNYGVGVARSRNLLKGWEKDPLNPIVKNNEDWKCPGHGSVVTDAEGRDLLLYHAYSTRDTVYVGRQGVVDQLIWGENGWPTINNRRGVAGQVRAQAPGFSDEFNGSELPLGWQWPKGDRPSTTVENGTLLLAPPASRAGDVIGGVVARSTTSGDYTAVTSVETGSLATGTMAGLSAFGDPENALGMGLRSGKLEVWRRQGNNHQVVATLDAPAGAMLHLRMTAREGRLFQFAVSADGTTYTDVGTEQNGEYLPPWDRGVRVALTAGGLTGGSARFSSLVITPVAPAK